MFQVPTREISTHILGKNSFNNLQKWIADVRNERGSEVLLVIVGNKMDLPDR